MTINKKEFEKVKDLAKVISDDARATEDIITEMIKVIKEEVEKYADSIVVGLNKRLSDDKIDVSFNVTIDVDLIEKT